MKVYKGTDENMVCHGKQYVLGEMVTEEKAKLCECGLHACEMPLDVLNYYPPNRSRYFEAEADDVTDERHSNDSKIVAKKMTLKAEIGIPGLVKAQVEYVKKQIGFDDAIKRADAEKENHATGDWGAASATGDCGAASATGDWGAASATGYQGAASATGDCGAASATGNRGAASATGDLGAASATGYQGAASATGNQGAASATGNRGAASATGDLGAASATGYQGAASATGDLGAASATGDWGAASATGYQGAASATGDCGAASATGNQGAASATGDWGAASATGYQGAASATGKAGVALAAGFECKAKGALGCAICCAERGKWDGEMYPILAVKAAIVDGEMIKADTWYMLKNGEFVEVVEND